MGMRTGSRVEHGLYCDFFDGAFSVPVFLHVLRAIYAWVAASYLTLVVYAFGVLAMVARGANRLGSEVYTTG